jgi:hypothetical protein
MSERDDVARSDLVTDQDVAGPGFHTTQSAHEATDTETWSDRSDYETPEIQGWALQWDASALRKANLARRMRTLREGSGEQ